MTNSQRRKIILNFIKKEKVGVLSTVNPDGKPEAAVMVISQTDDLELIFQTPKSYRKYTNLKKNPSVAIAFGWDMDEFVTVQYEGIAKEAKGKEIDECRKIHITKNPRSKKYAHIPENKYFKVRPKWVRYWDFKTDEKFVLAFN